MRKVARSGLGAQPGTGGTDSTGQIGPATIRPPIPESGARAPAGLTLSRTNPRSKHALRRIAQRNPCEDGGGAVASQRRRQDPVSGPSATRRGRGCQSVAAGSSHTSQSPAKPTPPPHARFAHQSERMSYQARHDRLGRAAVVSPGAGQRYSCWAEASVVLSAQRELFGAATPKLVGDRKQVRRLAASPDRHARQRDRHRVPHLRHPMMFETPLTAVESGALGVTAGDYQRDAGAGRG